jgi:predicted permease
MPGFGRVFGLLRERSREVDDELCSHVEMKAEELRRAGWDAGAAQREARRTFGDVDAIRRQCHGIQTEVAGARRRGAFVDALAQDLRFALRGLRANAGFSALAILTLALGIGANTAIFSIVNGLMLRPLPGIVAPHRLVDIVQGRDRDDFVSVSYPVFKHLRDHAETLSDVAAFDVASIAVGGEGVPDVYFGFQVTANYFAVLGAAPHAGRFFAPESWYPSVENAVVISDALWERRYGRDPAALGKTLLVNGYPVTLIGVAPPGFGGHVVVAKVDIWVPLGLPAPELHSDNLQRPRDGILELIGRLGDGATVAAATAEVQALADGFIAAEEGPGATYPLRVISNGALPGPVRGGATAFFVILTVVVALLLVITCVNVANMLLSRANERGREIAVRLSMGASRGRLVRQLLTESLLLATLAAGAGALMAAWIAHLLAAFQPPILPFPGMRLEPDFGLDARVLAYVVAVTGITTLAFGLVPALRATRPDLVTALKDAGAGGISPRSRLRGVLVAGQMATTLVLLIGSGLFLQAMRSTRTLDTGFAANEVHVATFDLGLNGYAAAAATRFFDDLTVRAAQLDGVEAAAVAGKLPLAGASGMPMYVDGHVRPDGGEELSLHYQSVSSDYFRTLRIPLLSGRTFTSRDGAGAPTVAIVNQTLAESFWPGEPAVGKRFRIGPEQPVEVIGVVADARYHGLVEATPYFAYFSFRQRPRNDMILHLLVGPGAAMAPTWQAVRSIVRELDPAVPMLSAAPLPEALAIHSFPQRLAAWITGVVGFFGLLLGATGIYGVTAHAVSRRSREIGVRIALGARLAHVRRMMVRQGMRAPAIGMLIGLGLAAWLTRFLGAFLVDVDPLDGPTFGAVVLLLGAVALAATLAPARRAARVDPVVTLRSD